MGSPPSGVTTRPMLTCLQSERLYALGLGVALGFSLEISAGHIVEQELEVHSEPTLVTLQQMLAERILVRYEYVQAPIQAVVVNLLPVQPTARALS